MHVGIGYANTSDAFRAGREVARQALEDGAPQRLDLVIAFCGGELDHGLFFAGLQSVVGRQVPIIGGSAVGLITNNNLSYDGHPAGAAILSAEDLSIRWASAGNMDRDEYSAGVELGGKIPASEADRLFLMFYDSIKVPASSTVPPVMNASPPLIQGIGETLRSNVPIVGSGVIGHMNFQPTWQFCGSTVETQHVVGALLAGDFSAYTRIMHGCTPNDGVYHTVTRIDGALIYELNGKPIVPMINELYDSLDWQAQIPVRRLTVGVNHGGKYDDFQEGNYVNRLIAGVLPSAEGIVIFEPDLEVGTQIQFMLRDPQAMIRSARKNTRDLLAEIRNQGKTPVFGLYIDCAGRNARFSETLGEEASEVVAALNRDKIPLLGFYSGVEVAPLLGRSRGLDWTGVLTVFAR